MKMKRKFENTIFETNPNVSDTKICEISLVNLGAGGMGVIQPDDWRINSKLYSAPRKSSKE